MHDSPVGRNKFYAVDDRSRECDMGTEMYEYHPNILDNLNGKYSQRTDKKNRNVDLI